LQGYAFDKYQGVKFNKSCQELNKTKNDVERLILTSAKRYKIDPDFLWVIAKIESNFHPCIVSPAGASGVMQLMPETAKDLGVTNIFDIEQNIDAGARYWVQLIEQFKTPQLYIAAYNAGPGAVNRKRYIPNFPETKKYLRKFLRQYQLRTKAIDEFYALQQLSVNQ